MTWSILRRPASLWPGVVLIAAGLFIYWPALHGAFLWDDPQYVTANPLLNDPARLAKAWLAPGSTMEFYPLQETALAWQWWGWGADPFGYHLTNVALHILSGFLLWGLLAQFGLRGAWLGGLLFIVHPLNVESVAWISEFKNTLSLPPLLLALMAMIRYDDERRRSDYLGALGLFTLAMLVKISAAPFPFVLLLFAWWKRGRLVRRDFLLAAPFLAVALVLSGLTVWAYTRYGQLHPDHPIVPAVGGVMTRIVLAGLSVSFYLVRFFWPWSPMPMYPQWDVASPSWYQFLPGLGWIVLLSWCGLARKSWGRHALLGLGFFLLMIAPFSGLVTQSYMYFTWVMDHFMYLPMIGLIGLSLAVAEKIVERWPIVARRPAWAAVGILMLLLAWQSRSYAPVWSAEDRLWSYAIAKNPGAWLAHYDVANGFRRQGHPDEAIAEYRVALRLHPSFDWSHNNLGLTLAAFPDLHDEAATEFREAIRLRPDFPEAHANLANVLAQDGDLNGAIAEYKTSLADQPAFAEARYDLALSLANAGRLEEAAAQLRELLRRQPGYVPAEDLLARLPVR